MLPLTYNICMKYVVSEVAICLKTQNNNPMY